ncbi:MAG: WbuC family cupin fold metalloprotein [Stenotrophobium sp.]
MNLRTISRAFLNDLATKADASPRMRTNFNFHEDAESLVQRLVLQLKRGTYIRPHRHYDLKKWEMTLVLAGEIDILLFDNHGRIIERMRLAANGETLAVELLPETWHSYVPVTDHVAFFEVKEGPYDAARITQFADWAPAENAAAAAAYLRWMETAQANDSFSNAGAAR